MARSKDSYTKAIQEKEAQRRKTLRQAKRARERRRKALRERRWSAARRARETARKNNDEAQKYLREIRVLRKVRSRASRLARIARHNRKVWGASGVSYYDGKKVASWMVPYLKWARANGWRGYLVSGWRDPVYSEGLCRAMCGAPSCPGRCAGRSSNHSGSTKPRGAIDVSDYYRFGQLMKKCPYSPRLHNALGARDPVHFSASGN
jgi:hypothetical protein